MNNSILRVEECMSKHGQLKTGYLQKCFKINFISSMTPLIYDIWFITCVVTVSNSLPGKNPTVLSVVQRENKNNCYL